jgi:regulator of protease activity HflC (stomatin/prohibitin superfamily)
MTIGTLLGFVAFFGWLMLLGGIFIIASNITSTKKTAGGVPLVILGALIGGAFSMLGSGLITVGSTQIAVIFQRVGGDPSRSGLWERPLGPGVHFVMPVVNEPFYYSTEVQNYTMSRTVDEGQVRRADAVEARTRDGQQVSVDVSVLYSIDATRANQVHIRFQNRAENDFVRPQVRSAVREKIALYSVNDLYGGTSTEGVAIPSKLPELQRVLNEEMSKVFAENGLLLQDVLLREITFSDEFIRAVESKQVAEQQTEQAKQEAERARTIARGQADADVVRARGQADALIEQARGQAESIKVRAAAEAEALRLISAELEKNPNLIQWRYVENLADNISLILLPSNSPFLFDLEQLRAQAQSGASGGATGPTPPTSGTPAPGN